MTLIGDFIESIENKIQSLISSHNSNENAHSTEMSKKVNIAQGSGNGNMNVVTNSSGNITTEAKPDIPEGSDTDSDILMNGVQDAGSSPKFARADHVHPKDDSIPIATSITPKADTENGSVGTGATWAKGDHIHPKSSIYAEATHSHTKSQITDFPTLATVATSGSYNDLSNKPTIPPTVTVDSSLSNSSTNPVQNKVINSALSEKAASTHNHTKSQITDFPSLATVATSGSYNDLSNKPTIPSVDSSLSTTSTNPVQNKVVNSALAGKAGTSAATQSAAGLMSAADKTKLDGIATGANAITYSNATQSADGLMSSSDKTKLDGIDTGANKITVDSSLSASSTNPVQNKIINTALSGKANNNHASTATTFGLGTSSNYGHTRVINNLTTTSTSNGQALHAAQGKALKDAIDAKPDLGTSATTAAVGNHNHDGTYLKSVSLSDIGGTVTVEKLQTAETGYVATYVVKQNGTQVGSSINIPKDYLVKSASLKVVGASGAQTASQLGTGYSTGDKYIDFTINVKEGTADTDSHIYLNVKDLVDAYTAGTGLTLTSGNQFKHTNSVTAQSTTAFKKLSYDTEGHITGAADVQKSDITGLGIPESDTIYSHPTPSGLGGAKSSGLYKISTDADGHITGIASVGASDLPSHTHDYISTTAGSVSASNLASNAVEEAKIKDGAVTSAKIADGTIVDADIASNAAISTSKISGLSTVATTGSYNDLSNKPSTTAITINYTDGTSTTLNVYHS